ncbi:MAG: transcription-repair coupling factor, partial [Terriglobia bacterium]
LREYAIPFTAISASKSVMPQFGCAGLQPGISPDADPKVDGMPLSDTETEAFPKVSQGKIGQPIGLDSLLIITQGTLPEGAIFPESRLALLAESDLFGEFTWRAPARQQKSAVSSFISGLSDLKAGDYVVHVDHGIGLYQGLRQIEVTGERRDFMLLTYQGDARLYVPLERLDLVEKYRSGADGVKPPLDRLGGVTWERTKSRVRRALRDMAAELLKLYAERKMSGGFSFSADTPWQKEFEDAFEYEETSDQVKALEEIKKDLESPQPMDRLLCGDVGYGKTELAMRAAFKVVQDGKQVAVLAPTTVLAFQHLSTFRERMAAFPVRIEMISRFRSPAEQKRTVEETAEGKIEILIGTHRLLSKDVGFKSLGLLIVDEEQRFGVAAKERLKRLRATVDVLTMSATPIPRTLHMSLGGLRDLSVIETPPRGRLAIQTTVAPFTSRLAQAALLQELERQGQVYFVHNRVESIFSMAAMLQRLAPSARFGVAHGQMAERDLERVMMKFVRGEYDVLVSTSIIENGLDIPRANTIVINRADRFGLAELYQLRGRVGRSDRRAYAYLLIPEEDSLTPLARRRLAALKEFSDLGAGFRLAALDLELRGTGNLLGAEQSGHLNAIGLDLYLKMLEQTTEELKGLPAKPEVHATLNLGVEIKIPEEYIADEGQRLRMYKRISGLSSVEARAELEAELTDRYGALPLPVMTLLDYGLLKSSAEAMLVQSVERKQDEMWVRFHPETPVAPESLTSFVRRRRDASLRPDGSLRFRMASASPIEALKSALQELQQEH